MSSWCGRSIYLFPLLGFIVVGLQNGVEGQSSSPAAVQNPASHGQITLDVIATDKSGKPVSGLQQQDFTVLDNKQPQKILSFEAVNRDAGTANPPVEAILLIDEANIDFTHLSYAREQVEKFLKHDGGELPIPVSMMFLTDNGIAINGTSTKDGNALAVQLTENKSGLRIINRSQGFYGANDRVQLSLNALAEIANYETARPGRKLLIWMSAGWPLLTGPRIQLSSKDQQGIFNTIVDLSNRLRQARITLYSVDPLGTAAAGGFRTFYYKDFVKGVKKSREVQIGNLGLQVLATQSGGLVLNSSNDVADEITTCITDANAFYTLTIESVRGDGPDEYNALEVKIDKPGLKARTRTGYYAQPAGTRAPGA